MPAYNRFSCRCSSCRRPLARGEGVLCGTVSEAGGWIVTCRRGVGCGPAASEKPKRAAPAIVAADAGSFISRVLANATEDELIARGWDVAAMRAEAAR